MATMKKKMDKAPEKKSGPKKIGMRTKFSAKHHQAVGSHTSGTYKGK